MEPDTRRDLDATTRQSTYGAYDEPSKIGPDDGRPSGDRDRNSITGLIRELRDETADLLRQEMALMRAEMSEKASKAGRNAASAGAGGAIALIGTTIILQALAVGAAILLVRWGWETNGWWIGPLIVGGVVALVGYILLQKGVTTLKHMSPAPQKTIDSLKEDKEWIKEKTSR